MKYSNYSIGIGMLLISFSWISLANSLLLDTKMSRVGIEANDKCFYEVERDNKEIISCTSGKKFGGINALGKIVGSSTGVPPYLAYANYIGNRILPNKDEANKNLSKKMGSGRRIIYCSGPCVLKDK